MTTTGIINWGILGYARIARLSAIPAILASGNGRVHALASRDADKLAEARKQVPDLETCSGYADLLRNPEIDAVYIPLPNSMHREWAIAALEAGKHVLCEKPLALDAAEARDMIAAARAHKRLLMEAFMYRYTDRCRQVQALLASGELGEIRHFDAAFRFFLDRAGTIKMQPGLGGGALYDVGVYPLNLLGMVAGTAHPVACHAEAEFSDGVDINTSILLRYDSGLLASLHCGFNAAGQMGAQIVGTRGRLDIPDTFLGTPGTITLTTAAGQRSIAVAETDRYAEEFRDFASAILENREPLFPLDETLRNLETLDMIRASLGKR